MGGMVVDFWGLLSVMLFGRILDFSRFEGNDGLAMSEVLN